MKRWLGHSVLCLLVTAAAAASWGCDREEDLGVQSGELDANAPPSFPLATTSLLDSVTVTGVR